MSGNVMSGRLAGLYACLALIAAALFYPALDTPFLLDDFQNLRDLILARENGVLAYLTEGRAGPGGRPLALLSFALQEDAWPGNPFAFKAVNLLIHLANGGLIFFITLALAPAVNIRKRSSVTMLAVLVAALWLLHPVQLSSVLYVVQRMNLLAGFFTLLGIYLFLYLRGRGTDGLKTPLLMAASVYLCTALAFLCKENGLLLPLYILCIEAVLLSGNTGRKIPPRLIMGILILPLAVTVTYLAWTFGNIIEGYGYRPFSPGERLLTQASVILDYLKIIFIPRPSDYSLFHDDYTVYHDFLENPRALISVAAVCFLVLVAWLSRQRARLLSFGIFWFLAGHLLESTFVPLELYFEHRNYLPSFGPLFMAGGYLVQLAARVPTAWVSIIILCSYPAVVIGVEYIELRLWADPHRQALVWAAEHPDSRRALDNLWNTYIIYGEKENAERTGQRMARAYPEDLYPHIKRLRMAYCYYGKQYDNRQWEELYARAAGAEYIDHAAVNELSYLLQEIAEGRCTFTHLARLRSLINIMAENSDFKHESGFLYEYSATVSVLMHDEKAALASINMAIKRMPVLDHKLYKVRILTAMGEYEDAGSLLEDIENETNFTSPLDLIKIKQARERLAKIVE